MRLGNVASRSNDGSDKEGRAAVEVFVIEPEHIRSGFEQETRQAIHFVPLHQGARVLDVIGGDQKTVPGSISSSLV